VPGKATGGGSKFVITTRNVVADQMIASVAVTSLKSSHENTYIHEEENDEEVNHYC
jgi:hypothetical protein